MNILVRNLNDLVTEEKLASLFRRFGEVFSVCIVRDKRSGQCTGIGFVDMPDQASAVSAIKALNHTKLFNEKIRVKEAKPQFGPEYFAENIELQAVVVRVLTALPEDNPAVPGAFGKSPGARKRDSARPKFPKREGPKPELKPRGESGGKPYSKYPFRSGGQAREGVRKEYKPYRERSFTPRSSGEKAHRPYQGRKPFPAPAGRPEFKPYGDKTFRPHPAGKTRGIGEKPGRPYTTHPPRTGADYKPRGERPNVPRPGGQPSGQGANSGQAFARFRGIKGGGPKKKFGGKYSFGHRKPGGAKGRPRFR